MLKAALYIHFPWCIRKCPYCDFNSHKAPENIPEKAYIDALVADFRHDLQKHTNPTISSIFLGGGTPSLFSAEALDKLFTALKTLCTFAPGLEITLEANPGTVEQQRFHAYRALGINRLSLGIQSFNSTHLKTLGRIHDGMEAEKAIEAARCAGFDNINLDLMHSLPNQTVDEAMEDIQKALDFNPEHLSWYQLTIEPNTLFHKTKPTLPHEEIMGEIEREGYALLSRKGYDHYEISAFAKPGKQAVHNVNYWLFGDYFGIGAGAHGKLTTDAHTVYRTTKYRQPHDYLKPDKPFLASLEYINEEALIFEYMLNLTRLNQPIALDLFQQKTGLSVALIEPKLKEAEQLGFIRLSATDWQVTDFGRRFTNSLQGLFLP